MTNIRLRLSLMLAGAGTLVACPGELISDPSFDVWCGDALCAPWQATGNVSRVPTWHARDFGVALADGAVLSQRSASRDPARCIDFEVIADVEASANVVLELDFLDDGTSEYEQPIPESHWAKLRFFMTAPTWYDSVRFSLRKRGKGRAVLAQIKANPSGECDGEPVKLVERPLGAGCETAEQCDSGVCAEASLDPRTAASRLKCGECSSNDPCLDAEVCGFGYAAAGTYAHCVPAGESPSGASCVTGAECASGTCAHAIPEPCPACESDDCKDVWRECEAHALAGTCL